VSRRGFTILELMAVVAVIAVLANILVPNFVRARATGRMSSCSSNLKNISTALEMYRNDWKGDFPASLSRLTPKYLRGIPTCSSVGRVTYVYQGTQEGAASLYTVICEGRNHHGGGLEANYPQYTSVTGLIERPY